MSLFTYMYTVCPSQKESIYLISKLKMSQTRLLKILHVSWITLGKLSLFRLQKLDIGVETTFGVREKVKLTITYFNKIFIHRRLTPLTFIGKNKFLNLTSNIECVHSLYRIKFFKGLHKFESFISYSDFKSL